MDLALALPDWRKESGKPVKVTDSEVVRGVARLAVTIVCGHLGYPGCHGVARCGPSAASAVLVVQQVFCAGRLASYRCSVRGRAGVTRRILATAPAAFLEFPLLPVRRTTIEVAVEAE